MRTSLHVLLEGLIDYAGLFPPAALSMQDAVRNFARYRDGEHAWALGRFVVPRERVGEVPEEFPLSVLGVDEVKAATVEELEEIKPGAFVELTDRALIGELAIRSLRAKIRTGGLVAEAFPATAEIAEFMRACKEAGVAFKATAGLHHPLRCTKPLTYEPNAPTGKMHGFINVFLAAALLEHAESILAEEDPRAFSFDDEGASWREHRVSTDALAKMRREFAMSFGSCSFEEPISDLRELGWL
jgi:hypothetical protein